MSYDSYDHEYERGMDQRRSVLGDDWVDRSVAKTTSFTGQFQDMITRRAWSDIWTRPGLDQRSRRTIVLAITIAQGAWDEFELHVRAALTGADDSRLTPEQLQEVLMQAAVYVGLPLANTAFSRAQAVLREVAGQIGYQLELQGQQAAPNPATGAARRTASLPALHYSVREPRSGKPPRHTLVFSHALGCDLSMWDAVAGALAADCRVVCYDNPGHGSSDMLPGLASMGELADDAARLLRELDGGPVIWVGLSMGAMIGQELALLHPALLQALVLANTTAVYPEAAQAMWDQRIATVQAQGLEAIADDVMARFFDAPFRTRHGAIVARFRRRLVSTDQQSYIASCHAVRKIDTSARMGAIDLPTLVIAGDLDEGTPVPMVRQVAEGIPGARFEVINGAAHLSAVEQPAAFAALLQDFIGEL